MSKEDVRTAQVLVEALPYIKRFQGKTVVIKLGGSVGQSAETLERFAQDIMLLRTVGIPVIVVHGGGKEITHWLTRLGVETKFIDGLRVTTPESLEVVEMVLSGKVNRDVIAAFDRAGARAVGLSGKDGGLLRATLLKSEKGDLGLVGEVAEVNAPLLTLLSQEGYIPVVASLGLTLDGQTVNINADEVAAAIAVAVKALKLIYLTDVEGILIDSTLKEFLELREAEGLMSHKDVQGGMLPKLACTVKAIKGGVSHVHMLDGRIDHVAILELFTSGGVGTMIAHSRRELAV